MILMTSLFVSVLRLSYTMFRARVRSDDARKIHGITDLCYNNPCRPPMSYSSTVFMYFIFKGSQLPSKLGRAENHGVMLRFGPIPDSMKIVLFATPYRWALGEARKGMEDFHFRKEFR